MILYTPDKHVQHAQDILSNDNQGVKKQPKIKD